MNDELLQSISDAAIRLRPLMVSQFVKPIKEMERGVFPPGHIRVLFCILANGQKPISMTDLALASCISKPNLTTMVDRLYSEGFVERSADEKDRRVINVSLTDTGMTLLKRQKKEAVSLVENKLSTLEESDILKLKRALDDIIEIIEKMEDKKK